MILAEKEQRIRELQAELDRLPAEVSMAVSPEWEEMMKERDRRRQRAERYQAAREKSRELTDRILQRKDKALRARALDELMALLQSENAEQVLAGLFALSSIYRVPCDKDRFKPYVLAALNHEDADVRLIAMSPFYFISELEEHLGVVSSLVDDPSPDIRRDVARLLAGAYRDGKNEQLASGLRQLLQDDNWEIKKEAMDALAQSPEHAEEMEDLAIELSKDPEHANEMMGWLARRPTINAKLATHLVEMIEEEGGPSHILHTSLTRWGGPVLSDEARAIFSDFCLRTLKDSISPGRRLQALETLKMTGDDWALSELEEIALGPDAEGVEDIIAATIEHLKRKGDGQR